MKSFAGESAAERSLQGVCLSSPQFKSVIFTSLLKCWKCFYLICLVPGLEFSVNLWESLCVVEICQSLASDLWVTLPLPCALDIQGRLTGGRCLPHQTCLLTALPNPSHVSPGIIASCPVLCTDHAAYISVPSHMLFPQPVKPSLSDKVHFSSETPIIFSTKYS